MNDEILSIGRFAIEYMTVTTAMLFAILCEQVGMIRAIVYLAGTLILAKLVWLL